MAVVTISRQLGSLGDAIAYSLASGLKFHHLDKESLESMLEKYGISEVKVEHYDEKKPNFWDLFSKDRDTYLHFMKTALYEFACGGSCVVLGRGGQVLFQDIPGVLHVRMVSSSEVRTSRIRQEFGCDERLARQIMQQSDRDRSGFHRFFFNTNWETTELYDIIFNTGVFKEKAALKLLKDAVHTSGIMDMEKKTERRLADLCLAQRVKTKILYVEKVPIRYLEVNAQNGIVTIKGSVNATSLIQRCEELTSRVPGVKKVNNEIFFLSEFAGL
jgi:cytidylate kinase